MDDASGEFMERAELVRMCRKIRVQDGETGMHEAVGVKQGVDSRDEARQSKKTDQLFVKMTMKADGKE